MKTILLTQSLGELDVLIVCSIFIIIFSLFFFLFVVMVIEYVKGIERKIKDLIKQSFTFLEENSLISASLKLEIVQLTVELEKHDFVQTTTKILSFLKNHSVKKDEVSIYEKLIKNIEIELDSFEKIKRMSFNKSLS